MATLSSDEVHDAVMKLNNSKGGKAVGVTEVIDYLRQQKVTKVGIQQAMQTLVAAGQCESTRPGFFRSTKARTQSKAHKQRRTRTKSGRSVSAARTSKTSIGGNRKPPKGGRKSGASSRSISALTKIRHAVSKVSQEPPKSERSGTIRGHSLTDSIELHRRRASSMSETTERRRTPSKSKTARSQTPSKPKAERSNAPAKSTTGRRTTPSKSKTGGPRIQSKSVTGRRQTTSNSKVGTAPKPRTGGRRTPSESKAGKALAKSTTVRRRSPSKSKTGGRRISPEVNQQTLPNHVGVEDQFQHAPSETEKKTQSKACGNKKSQKSGPAPASERKRSSSKKLGESKNRKSKSQSKGKAPAKATPGNAAQL